MEKHQNASQTSLPPTSVERITLMEKWVRLGSGYEVTIETPDGHVLHREYRQEPHVRLPYLAQPLIQGLNAPSPNITKSRPAKISIQLPPRSTP